MQNMSDLRRVLFAFSFLNSCCWMLKLWAHGMERLQYYPLLKCLPILKCLIGFTTVWKAVVAQFNYISSISGATPFCADWLLE